MAKKKIYLDYASTTPVDSRVLEAMLPYFSDKFGNCASLHSFGVEALEALKQSRRIIAKSLNANPKEVIFTGSATESNNLALKGVALAHRSLGEGGSPGHIIISSIEHACIIETAKWLAKNPCLPAGRSFKITIVPVDKNGIVNPNDVKKAIRKDTILVSVMHANNEIGTIQPIVEIGKICRQKKVLFHTDAAQSFGKIPIDVKKMNIDLLTASSHKMYGPKGAALLYIKDGIKIEPILHGGEQEFGLRSSTVNIPAIVGFAKAVEICQKESKKELDRQAKLRDKIVKEILKTIPRSYLNGDAKNRLSNNVNIRFDAVEGESLAARLNGLGIAVSTASACASPKLQPSHVLLACGLKPEQAHGAIRITLGRFTKEKDVDYLIKSIKKVVSDLRKISPFWKK
ncbi:MAG: cysteine desulfurase family protein [Candidatus Paceibacterota bacterium]|jgi:cysteine desulfurase